MLLAAKPGDGECPDQFSHGAVFRIGGNIVEVRFVSSRS